MATSIMIVEDESVVSMDLENRLRALGYLVVASAGTGDEAVAAAASACPDLVLMDVMLRGPMDGVDAARVIHQRHGIPIIFLTAYSDEPTLQRAKTAEPFGYILKPFNDRDLRTAIEIGLYKNEVESKLRRIERWLATTLDSMGDAVLSIDTKGAVNFMNPLAEALTGWPRDQAGGKHIAEVMRLVHPRTRDQVDNPVLRALQGPPTMQIEEGTMLIARDGREIPIDDSAAPVRDESGSVTGGVLVFRDISERLRAQSARRKAEEQLRQTKLFESIGNLAGGVAHDFNNLMTVVLGETQLLLERAADARAQRSLKIISSAGERAAALTRQLLAFSGRQVLRNQELDVNELALHVQGILEEVLGEDIRVVSDLTQTIPTVHADASQIQQVLLNIAANARDTMPNGGTVTIQTHAETVSAERAAGNPNLKTGAHVVISITDTGPGIDEATRARIFEPFFLSKESGRGIGLAAAFGIVRQSGGTITVESRPHSGTTFHVYLPRGFKPAESMDGTGHSPAHPAGHERILVVEDEEILRELIQEILQGFGFEVITAATTAEARALFTDPLTRADLILSDIVMPGESGPELIQDLQIRNPDLKVIFMSAYSDSAVARNGMLTPGSRFIEKPFNPIKLAQLVREVLDGRSK